MSSSIQKSSLTGELSTSQKQAVIKLIEKERGMKDQLKTGVLSLY